MKKINLLLVFCLAILTFAQAQIPPQAFNYSAVARNAAGQPIATATIGIKISILKTSTLGSTVYSENHFINTDAFGLFNLVIGSGAVQSGSMSTIDWSNDNYYLKVGMDATGGTNFLTMGTTQLLSVPYAMHAATADSIIGGIVNETDPIFTNSIAASITATDTTNWNTDVSATNELQTISISNDTIYLSNGGFVRLPNISGGKTYIELFGDVTNAQADSILLADLGQNTQFVYITGTTQLTSVNLTGVNSLIELKISDNPLLTSVSLPSLTRCSQVFRIEFNNALTTLNIPLLARVGDMLILENPTLGTFAANVLSKAKDIIINSNGLTSISFPALTTMSGQLYIFSNASLATANFGSLSTTSSNVVIQSNGLTSISLPALTTVSGQLNISSNASLATANFGSLSTAGGINIQSNGLTSISFPALATMSSGGLSVSGNASLATANFGNLSTAGGINIQSNGLTSISFPALTTVSGQLYISSNASLATANFGNLSTAGEIQILQNGLTSISFPALTTLSGQLSISSNASLSSVNLSQQLNTSQLFNFSFYGNALPSSEINEILALLVSNGTSSISPAACISLNNQNPPAPPTGQGIIDYNTLVNAVNCIEVD
jgi:O-acetyl-ADP-ribose deacetylase (regulator of RNase III)